MNGERVCRVGRFRRSGSGDRGSGTLWMVALIGAVWAVADMAMTVGGVRAARHRAYAAADLAALAAAAHAAEGADRACGLAARIARGSGGHLRRCTMQGHIVDVVVASALHPLPGLGRLTAVARARAGPVTTGEVPESERSGVRGTMGGAASGPVGGAASGPVDGGGSADSGASRPAGREITGAVPGGVSAP